MGRPIRVEATVDLGQLTPDDVTVELYSGPLDEDGQLSNGKPAPMQRVDADGKPLSAQPTGAAGKKVDGAADDGKRPDGDTRRVKYVVEMPCTRSGQTGYTVRVLPQHANLPDNKDLALIRWA